MQSIESSKDQVKPQAKWTFNDEVAACFDDMLRRSIPQYDVMRSLVMSIGEPFVQHKTDIVDLGCSRGDALYSFVDKFGVYVRYIGVDVSEPMLKIARERFQGYVNCNRAEIKKLDLRQEFPAVNASLTLSILTLQFTPIEYRHRILADVYNHTIPGGAFILVEKILGSDPTTDNLLKAQYREHKHANGYSYDDIDRKAASLEGVLVPVAERWNLELLEKAGFKSVECFWRCLNFAGWVAIK